MPRRFTIGREKGCDVPIADESVSRLHAEIWLAEDGALMVADRGSSNGTTLLRGGQSIPLRQDVVLLGDAIRFGGVTLAVSDLIEAVELKDPGALTPKGAGSRAPLPPPPPPPIAKPAHAPPAPPRPGGGPLVRCECGAIKTLGQTCPGCNR